MTTKASPLFVAQCEFDLALTYALTQPKLARQCASDALTASIQAKRPDLTYRINSFLGAL